MLDSKFLKFWGQFLLRAAEGQAQLEQMSAWMEKGFTGITEMTDMFQRFYGLHPAESPTSKTAQDKNWQTAIMEFQASFSDFAKLWGWVPEKQYRDLEKAHIELKQQVAEQKKIIDALRAVLDEKGMGHMEFFQRLQQMAQEQNRQFQDLIKNIRES